MSVTNIPDDHHVVRHCKKRQTIRENGVIIGIFPDAFLLRPASPPQRPLPETYLSTIYFEHFEGNDDEKMRGCKSALAFQPKPEDALAQLQVAKIKAPFDKASLGIRVTHEPKRANSSYSAIRPQRLDEELAAQIASSAVVKIAKVSGI